MTEKSYDERRAEFEARLEPLPQEAMIAVAFRAAMRVAPYVSIETAQRFGRLAQASIRSTITSGVAILKRTPEVIDAASSAASADARAAARSYADAAARSAAHAARAAAFDSDIDSVAQVAARAIARATDTASSTVPAAARSATRFAAFDSDIESVALAAARAAARATDTAAAVDAAIDRDIDSVASHPSDPFSVARRRHVLIAAALRAEPLWPDSEPHAMAEARRDLREKLSDIGLAILADWYDDRMQGWATTEPWERRWILQPDEWWRQESRALGRALAEIKTEAEAGRDLAKPIRRARAIFLGHGGAGKTSLVRVLNGGEPTAAHEVTPGAHQADARYTPDVTGPLREEKDPSKILAEVVEGFEKDVAVHFWDFGGQMMTHATHQFFLRRRCLYVIVVDGRNRDDGGADAEYWLSYIRAFAGDATPALIVGNKAETSPVEVDLATIKRRHANVVDYYKLSCTEAKTTWRSDFERFLERFKAELTKLAEIGEGLTQPQGAALREIDAALRADGRLPIAQLLQTFTKRGIDDERARQLLAYFDLLGVVVWFDDKPALRHMAFSPAWITDGVYSVLYSKAAYAKGGRLSEADFYAILDAAEKGYTPEDKRLIMEAMKAFKTAFEKRGEWIVPAILPVAAEEHSFDTAQPVSVRLRFEAFLPPQLLSQLICERQSEIVEEAVWRAGAHLRARGNLKAEALVRADYIGRALRIDVSGRDAQSYLGILQDAALDELRDLPDLQPEVELRLDPAAAILDDDAPPPSGEEWIPLKTALRADRRDLPAFPHLDHDYSTKAALGAAPLSPELRHGDVFLSHTRDDEALLRDLDRRLYYANVSTWWDRRGIGAGEWEKQIDDAIDRAKALIVLWTPTSAGRPQVEREVDRFAAAHGEAEVIHLMANGVDVDAALPKYKHLNMQRYALDDGFADPAAIRRQLGARGVEML